MDDRRRLGSSPVWDPIQDPGCALDMEGAASLRDLICGSLLM